MQLLFTVVTVKVATRSRVLYLLANKIFNRGIPILHPTSQYPSGLRLMAITAILSPLASLSPELTKLLKEATDQRLRQIINVNITTRFAVSSSALVDFRLAVADKDIENDATILDDFHRLSANLDWQLIFKSCL